MIAKLTQSRYVNIATSNWRRETAVVVAAAAAQKAPEAGKLNLK